MVVLPWIHCCSFTIIVLYTTLHHTLFLCTDCVSWAARIVQPLLPDSAAAAAAELEDQEAVVAAAARFCSPPPLPSEGTPSTTTAPAATGGLALRPESAHGARISRTGGPGPGLLPRRCAPERVGRAETRRHSGAGNIDLLTDQQLTDYLATSASRRTTGLSGCLILCGGGGGGGGEYNSYHSVLCMNRSSHDHDETTIY
jgi:hypothetical protein